MSTTGQKKSARDIENGDFRMIPSLLPIMAYILIASAAIPSIYRMRKNRSSKDVSLLWQGMIFAGVIVIFVYALQVGEIVFILGGVLNIVSLSTVIATAIWYRRQS